VAGGGGAGADSMLHFRLERVGGGMKHCRKMKQICTVNSAATNGRLIFKATISYFKKNICKWDLVLFISSRRIQQ
jgi:hypothetical protein